MAARALCSVDGCGKPRSARGFCRNHYMRHRSHGDPLAGKAAPGEPMAWLLAHVGHEGSDCLVWPFGRLRNGYGHITIDGVTSHASRAMCSAAHGDPSDDQPFALHSCGGGPSGCVHPQHLRWGTQQANMLDSVEDGTRSRGEDQHASKLTEAAVQEIRASKARLIDLAAKFGVHPETISRVRKRQAWAWLE